MRAGSPDIPQHELRSPSELGEPLFEEAFENAPQAMALLSDGGSIVRANRSLCQLLGFTRKELEALSCVHITHPDDFQTESQQRRRLASADIGRYELTLRYVRKDSEPIWVRLSVAASGRGGSQGGYLVAVVERVSALPTTTRKGDESWHREFSDSALSAVHEIGNMLTPLMLNTEMILEHATRRELRDSAQQIFKAARRIAFSLRRLRGIGDGPAVAYVGQSRMLDLRLIEPSAPLVDDESGQAPA
jgi:PAS domain S-box-containing protein